MNVTKTPRPEQAARFRIVGKLIQDAVDVAPQAADGDPTYSQENWLHRCGAPMCLAGWAAHASLDPGEVLGRDGLRGVCSVLKAGDIYQRSVDAVSIRARLYLGLDRVQAHELFNSDARWPEPFAKRYRMACTDQDERAMAAAAVDLCEYLAQRAEKGEPLL